MAPKSDVYQLDLYELLNISVDAGEKEIRRAYRKKALKCHPDKNPDNPSAAQLFHQLSEALELLTDEAAKKVYDKLLLARKAARIRLREQDSKRKKLREELEEREKTAESDIILTESEKLKAEIDRLRKEGSSILKEETAKLAEDLKHSATISDNEEVSECARIKLKWKITSDNNGGYNEDNLRTIFNKYGDISAVIVSKKRLGSALVEFTSQSSAKLAAECETGFMENPIKVKLLGSESSSNSREAAREQSNVVTCGVEYENSVLQEMKRAEERKRIIAEMMKQDQLDT